MIYKSFLLSVPLVMVLASGCQGPEDAIGVADTKTQVATLYRSGSLMKDLRLHFGSFDVEGEANDFNINNCEMTARVLNSNLSAQWTAMGLPDVGFWCEPGPFREDGLTPTTFDAEYPTGARVKAAP